MKRKSWVWLWVLPLLVYATGWCMRDINADVLYVDERKTVKHLGDPFELNTPIEIVESVAINSPHHAPGYFVLLGGWTNAVGYSQTALRYLSVLFGLLAIAGTYRLATDWFSPRAGVYAAALMSVTTFNIFYLHEMRMYSLLVLGIIFILWIYFRIIRVKHPPRRWEWGGLFVGTLGLIYTHVFAFFALAAIGLYHLLFVKKDRCWWIVTLVMSGAGLLFLPWLQIIISAASIQGDYVTDPLPSLAMLGWISYLFGNGNLLLVAALAIGCGVALLSRRRAVYDLAFFGLAMFVALAIGNALVPLVPLRRARYFLIFWPVLALLVGAGFAQLRGRWQWTVLPVMALWLVTGPLFQNTPEFAVYTNRGYGAFPPYPQALKALNRQNITPQPTELIFMIADDNALMEYVTDVGDYYFKLLQTPGFVVRPHTLGDAHNDLNAHTIALDTLRAYPLIWYIDNPDALSESDQALVSGALARTHDRCESWDDGLLRIDLYARLPFSCDLLDVKAGDPPLIVFPALNVGLVDMQTASVATDGKLPVATAWSVSDDVPYHTYSVSLKIYDTEGNFMIQADFELPHGTLGWQLTTFNTGDLPAGTYEIRAVVYNWQTGERVEGHLYESDNMDAEITVRQIDLPLEETK